MRHRFTTSGSDRDASDQPRDAVISRSGLLTRIGLGLGAVSAGAAAARGLAAAGASGKPTQDHEVLLFALTLEELQSAFYSQALNAGKLTGEVRQFAEVVGGQERDHLRYLRGALGSAAPPPPKFTFGDAITDQKRFLATAVMLEDTGLAAYNGQTTNLSAKTLKEIGKVISVEARHSAWVRSLDGRQPAPVAVDVPISAAQAHADLKSLMT